jgi:hypothetical protein
MGTPSAGTQDGALSSTPTADDDDRPGVDGAASVASDPDDRGDDLRRRAEAVEALPLAERADAFAALHDDLRTRLEQGGAPRA